MNNHFAKFNDWQKKKIIKLKNYQNIIYKKNIVTKKNIKH
jgi:hypothetical protein